MINDIKTQSSERMKKSVNALMHELTKLRSGRAHPSLVENITVESYGSEMPLSQVASISVSDPRTLAVTPWDKSMVQPIEKAILNSELGLNPVTAGLMIRIPLPPLTEERRKNLIKVAKGEAENSRVAIRNIRRDANNQVKDLLKAKDISEDEQRSAEDAIQKLTDSSIKALDEVLANKEKDLMEI